MPTDIDEDALWAEVGDEDTSAAPAGTALADTLQTEGQNDDTQVEPQQPSTREELPPQRETKKADDQASPALDQNQLLTTIERLNNEIRGLHGRYGGLTQKIEELSKPKAQATVPSASEIKEATTPQEWDDLKRDYPDWGTGIEKYMDMREAKLRQQFGQAKPVDPMQNERIAAMSQQLENLRVQQEAAKVMEVHPDLPVLKADPNFHMWIDNLPPDLQKAARGADSTAVIKMISFYKSELPTKTADEVQASRQQKLRQAVTHTRGNPAPQPNATSLDSMSEDQYWALLAREEKNAARH